MKKRWLSIMMAAALVAAMPAGAVFAEEAAEGEATAVTTVGPDEGTHFEAWSFVMPTMSFMEKWLSSGMSRIRIVRSR